MNVSDAIASRRTVRAFLPREVPAETIRDILCRAARAPSGGNLQPWRVYVLDSEVRDRLVSTVATRMRDQPRGEGAEYHIYPPDLKEPYRSRRYQIGESLYATLGISRDDKEGRRRQFARNFEFFGARSTLMITIDRDMEPGQWSDVGMFLQNVMLLDRENGLHTAAQEAWAFWQATVRQILSIPENEIVFCGMALGYVDDADVVNSLETTRVPLEEFTTFVTLR
jgi:nitroreductase